MAALSMSAPMNEGLPSSVHTEITVLGAMLLDAVAVTDATAKLRPEDFSLDSHQRIYRVMLDLLAVGHAIDYITVMDALSKRRELDAIGGPAYLAYLSEGIPRHPKVEDYVRIIKDKSLLRELLSIFNDGMVLASDQNEEATKVLNDVEVRLAEVADSAIQRGFSGIADIVASSFGSIDALYEQGREVTGLATHYIEFDKMTSGLQPSELIIIAARPSMGKTAWAINIAQNCAVKDGKVVAIFSLEMSKESLLRRMLASESAVSSRKLQTGFIPREDKGKLIAALDRLMTSKMFVDDTPGITLAEMRAKARRLRQQEGSLDLIVIDYLQLMTGSAGSSQKKFENRTQEVSSISRGLKALAKELQVPVVALSQLSRGSEQRTGDKKPLLSDLRESGSIEQDADVVAFIHREEYYDRENEDIKGQAEIIIAKQRNGPTGTVKMAYLADFTRFENLDTMHGESGGGDAY
ncbi:replicative DNA helicase [Granulicella mallensis]|jgi:replicative DNA helicase|uniref:Replicative DNA helicase n=1 Tax=Granulicella mallensis (strain ATCC BAA-1857 / DSM 23137 / MP5ACTX8) TaxID=682795 RepID=G8NZV2_GRAMM|nr:replicative DNA helicase [Granulicella mallensis]AEU34579.1 replicative DNA helicase [Granulicella mallensis MP5ACTX8]